MLRQSLEELEPSSEVHLLGPVEARPLDDLPGYTNRKSETNLEGSQLC